MPVRLIRKGLQPTVNSQFGDTPGSSKRAVAPLCAGIGRLCLNGPVVHHGHLVILVVARLAGAALVVQDYQELLPIELALLAASHSHHPQPPSDSGICFTGAAGRHELGALHDRILK